MPMIECDMCSLQIENSNTNEFWFKIGDEKGSTRGLHVALCRRCQAVIANYIITTRGSVGDIKRR